jgi:hypothetical protein
MPPKKKLRLNQETLRSFVGKGPMSGAGDAFSSYSGECGGCTWCTGGCDPGSTVTCPFAKTCTSTETS